MEGSVPVSDCSSPVRPNRKPLSKAADEEAMELLWQDGHVVVQRQPPHVGYGDTPTGQPPAGGVEDQTLNYGPLFIREDEIDSWLHYDEPFYGIDFWRFQDGGPSESGSATGESMLVDSVHAALAGSPSFVGYGGGGGSTGAAKSEMMRPAQEPEPEPPPQRPRSAEDRKRTGGAEPEEADCDSEDAKFGATNVKKPRCRAPVPLRRSRSSEVHNRSERKRRDRINGKIRALQELIPRSAKAAADKVSTLDCAIEYLKMLQQQLQMMMSMGCGGMVLMTTYPSMSVGMSVGDPMPMLGNNMVPSAVPCPPFPASSPSAAAAFAVALPSVQSHPMTYLLPQAFTPIEFGMNPVQQQQQQLPLHPNFAYPYRQYPGLLLQTHYSQ